MKIIELLESYTGYLYHGTNLVNAQRIIADNTIAARTPIHNTNIPQKFKSFTKTVSLTRNHTVATAFSRASASDGRTLPVIFVLDYALLHRDLGNRIQPYDDLDSLDKMYNGGQSKLSSRGKGNNEYEEAVFGGIPNVDKYTSKILIDMSNVEKSELLPIKKKYSDVFNNGKVKVANFMHQDYTGYQFLKFLSTL